MERVKASRWVWLVAADAAVALGGAVGVWVVGFFGHGGVEVEGGGEVHGVAAGVEADYVVGVGYLRSWGWWGGRGREAVVEDGLLAVVEVGGEGLGGREGCEPGIGFEEGLFLGWPRWTPYCLQPVTSRIRRVGLGGGGG